MPTFLVLNSSGTALADFSRGFGDFWSRIGFQHASSLIGRRSVWALIHLNGWGKASSCLRFFGSGRLFFRRKKAHVQGMVQHGVLKLPGCIKPLDQPLRVNHGKPWQFKTMVNSIWSPNSGGENGARELFVLSILHRSHILHNTRFLETTPINTSRTN